MALLDERVQLLIAALQRGGATGIASAVSARIEQAEAAGYGREDPEEDDVREDDAEEIIPGPRVPEEGEQARGLRQLMIAGAVVEGLLHREIDLVPAIGRELSVLRAQSERDGGEFHVKEVVVDSGLRSADGRHALTSGQRVTALTNLLHAWKAAWGLAVEGR